MRLKITLILTLALLNAVPASARFDRRPLTTALTVPTAYTLNEGEVAIGIGPVSYGLTQNIEVGTNLLLLFLGVNAYGKLSLVEPAPGRMGYAVGGGFFNIDIGDIASVTGIPVFASATRIIDGLNKLHFNAQVAYLSEDVSDEATGSVSGTSVTAAIESQRTDMAILVGEAGYDLSFRSPILGGGVIFGWESFRLRLGATLLPDVFPVIGLWWRFFP